MPRRTEHSHGTGRGVVGHSMKPTCAGPDGCRRIIVGFISQQLSAGDADCQSQGQVSDGTVMAVTERHTFNGTLGGCCIGIWFGWVSLYTATDGECCVQVAGSRLTAKGDYYTPFIRRKSKPATGMVCSTRRTVLSFGSASCFPPYELVV